MDSSKGKSNLYFSNIWKAINSLLSHTPSKCISQWPDCLEFIGIIFQSLEHTRIRRLHHPINKTFYSAIMSSGAECISAQPYERIPFMPWRFSKIWSLVLGIIGQTSLTNFPFILKCWSVHLFTEIRIVYYGIGDSKAKWKCREAAAL